MSSVERQEEEEYEVKEEVIGKKYRKRAEAKQAVLEKVDKGKMLNQIQEEGKIDDDELDSEIKKIVEEKKLGRKRDFNPNSGLNIYKAQQKRQENLMKRKEEKIKEKMDEEELRKKVEEQRLKLKIMKEMKATKKLNEIQKLQSEYEKLKRQTENVNFDAMSDEEEEIKKIAKVRSGLQKILPPTEEKTSRVERTQEKKVPIEKPAQKEQPSVPRGVLLKNDMRSFGL